jgi:hypothetical protein
MADIGTGTGALLGIWVAKLVGSTAGAGVSLIYLLPRGRREAATRFVTGVSCGMIFGAPTGLWIEARLGIAGDLSRLDIMLAGSAAASLCAWWVLGALARIAGRYGTRPGTRD